MKDAKFLRMLMVIALIALTSTLLFGQAVNFGTIHGRVTDKSDAAIAGAEVKATQVGTGLVRTATSTENGDFVFPNLPVGQYQVQVTAKGFKEFKQTGITLTVGSSAAVNAVLEVGSVSETVEVRADAAMVETHENSITTLIDNNRIMEMPLNGRNAPDLVMLSGAASNASVSSQDLLSTKNYGNGSSGASQTISVGGGQQNANNYLLDGGDNNDSFSNVNAPLPNPDAIQEFSVQTSGLSARYGKQAGAVVNVVTKSGTNKFHGSVFEFMRNPIINAKHVLFTAPTATYRDATIRRNQYGGTFGGPIVKDKLFFFTSYQGTRQISYGSAQSAIVPTSKMLQGDFTDCPKTFKSGYGASNLLNLVAHPLNAQALALAKYLPKPDETTASGKCGNVTYTIPSISDEDQGVAKVDWNISSKHTAFVRYFGTDFRSPVTFDATNILTQANSSQFSRFQSVVFGDTYSFDSGIVNSVHATLKRLAVNRGPANDMINFKTLGVNVATPEPAGMVLSVGNYFSVGSGSAMPGHFINNAVQLSDDVDIIRGKHQISFGANWMKMQLNYLSTFQSNGQFTFSGGYSGDNLADFLLGLPSNFVQGNPEWENWRMDYIGFYIHDNIKLRPNLTLNIGTRWEPYLPSIDTAKRGSHFDYNAFVAGTHSTVYPNAPAGLLYCGDAGVPCAFQERKWKQFSPRMGIIWDPRNKGRETIRAGYGVFFDSPEMYYFDRYADNSPFGSSVSFAPVQSTAAGFTNPYTGQTNIPAFPTPFPQSGTTQGYFPSNGVYINNSYDTKPMYVQNWNLSVEKQLSTNWSISATYLGSKTTHIWVAYEANPGLNQAVPSNAGPGCTANQAASTSNTNCRRALYVAGAALQAAKGLTVNPGSYFSNMTTLWDGANSTYNALLLSTRHRFNKNFTLMANYTWSHCLSDQDFSGELTNSRPALSPTPWVINPQTGHTRDYGPCAFDVHENLNASVVISSPKREGFVGKLMNNWQLAPMLMYRTGTPFTVLEGIDRALIGSTTSYKDRPDLVGDPYSGTCTLANGGGTYAVGSRNCWFNISAFSGPRDSSNKLKADGTYGTVSRNSLYGPGSFRFDTAVSRKFKLVEGKELTLRFETFNLFNHPVLGNPNASLNSASIVSGQLQSTNFGRITSQIGDGRTFQGAIKFTF